jgi:exonuclease SbcC
MHVHHLSVTAFGPFVDTAEVDFDVLCDAGVFLLSGATGSGKSSVLDAVCFALYGAVPGDRQGAGRLRSDQAPGTLMPQVTLEVSLSGRRFRVVRSPAWQRPKKRGRGTTREQARVALSERTGDAWVHLTSRLDEAGDLLAGLLGMNLDQFCQVALLPQGHFQAFLLAKPDERQRLLARLFHTGRFERVEAWLRDHRLALRRRSDEHARGVGDLVSRISEAAHRAVPEACDDLASAADSALAAWADEVRGEASTRRATAFAEAEEAGTRHETAAAELAATRELARSRSRVVAAAETLDRLEHDLGHHLAEVARLDGARRAQGLLPLARLVDERTRVHAAAERRARASQAGAARVGVEVAAVPAEIDRTVHELARLSALLPAEQQLDALREQESGLQSLLDGLAREEELATAEVTSLSSLERELQATVAADEAAAQSLPGHEAEVQRLRRVVAAHGDGVRLTAELELAGAEHEAARHAVVDLREQLLDLRERRIAGMAAELAGGLVVGGDCPVCGSIDHPRPAHSSTAQPSAEAEQAAQHAVDDAQAVELARRLRVRDLETALAAAHDVIGDSGPSQVQAQLSSADAGGHQARSRLDLAEQHRERLSEARSRAAELGRADAGRRLRVAELSATLAQVQAHASELETQVAAARGGHRELRAAVLSLTERRDLLRAVLADRTALDLARAALDEATTARDHAVLEAGFDDAVEAGEAVLSHETVAALEESVQDHRTALVTARQVLDETGAAALLAAPEPDVSASEARAGDTAEDLERLRAAHETAARTDDRVHRLTDGLVAALAAWAPVRDELAVATAVSAFAEGKASDNRLQMRLSAYVLAFRLSQVVAAANARLAGMSEQRYSLEHVARRGAGESRGGLSLLVRDDWSGESREPVTLSGGETFVVSLALALGLADVVTQEAGGADLQTLFVDEGFGCLDAETLDDVLDILDSLRQNGRAVGVVRHVAEMRDRIPTQLVVSKARTGSTLRVVG